MASTQPIQRPIQKILDPTKIGTWNIVRRPPVENHSIIQGKPREQSSNAFKTFQWQEGARLRKALNALTHGKNIFVYNNIRTNQVKNSVLSQLVYHGKKTVPASLRKDMWVPYFSAHFNEKKVGLRAYHLLREFSMQRQLAPPREMITITEEFLQQKRPRDPNEAKKFDEEYKDKLGWLMDKKQRARVLMDQKATSVADMAAVLAIQEEELKNGFADGKRGYLTRTARQRRRAAREQENELAEKHAQLIANFEKAISTPEIEYKIQEPHGNTEYDLKDDEVKILWYDLQDARYAESWPERVRHGELELTRQHVIPGQKLFDLDVLADHAFEEKKQA
ncbi:conserved hypothetical protein [Paecilomyces variotii No. 5]|uniref:Large ribosomal subunit protein mL67 n=1 Tax=Byssochlamys spectabilis (strain No. 5 / NBRC 109023) TaxID=1356009 RepID=V5FX42_BYSSN|nr:conserved hypothetical protein [Paecilomyces variotii No. 5]